MTEHTLASAAQFRDWLATTSYSSSWSGDAATIRRLLEESTRDIVAYCGDSGAFGPITATLDYDLGTGALYDDPRPMLWDGTHLSRSLFPWIISITSATKYDGTDRDSSTALVQNTDYFLTPYQTIGFDAPFLGIKYKNGTSAENPFNESGMKVLALAGEFGWQDKTLSDTTLSGAVSDTTTKTVSVTAATNLSPGQTILINSERMYIESISSNDLTVERGIAGSTSATHSTSDLLYIFQYPPSVVQACLDLTRIAWTDRVGGLSEEISVAGATYSVPSGERDMILHTIDSYATHSVSQGVTF
jgi:hypothetical protein